VIVLLRGDNKDDIDDCGNIASLANSDSRDNDPESMKLLPNALTNATGRDGCKFAYGEQTY
jgi:hypothetical protein